MFFGGSAYMSKRIVLKYQRSLNNRHSKGEKIW